MHSSPLPSMFRMLTALLRTKHLSHYFCAKSLPTNSMVDVSLCPPMSYHTSNDSNPSPLKASHFIQKGSVITWILAVGQTTLALHSNEAGLMALCSVGSGENCCLSPQITLLLLVLPVAELETLHGWPVAAPLRLHLSFAHSSETTVHTVPLTAPWLAILIPPDSLSSFLPFFSRISTNTDVDTMLPSNVWI